MSFSESDKEYSGGYNDVQVILDHTLEAFVLADLNGKIRAFNKKAELFIFKNIHTRITQGSSIYDYMPAEREIEYQQFLNRVAKGEIIEYERRYDLPDGTNSWFEFSLCPVFEGETVNAICIRGRDITKAKEAEILARSFQQSINRAVIQAQEKERTTIGTELHDNVNQMLASAKIYLSYAMRNPEESPHIIEKSLETLHRVIQEIREISHRLVAPSLGDLGLIEAIHELSKSMFHKEHFTFVGTNVIKRNKLNDELKLCIFRIIQEQFSNIMKYANASKVGLRVDKEGTTLKITISDNGRGFDVKTRRKGIGFTNIYNRAVSFNGKMDIDSKLGKGTTLTVIFDLAA